MRLSRGLFLLVLLTLTLPVTLQVLDEASVRHRREQELRTATLHRVEATNAELERAIDGARRFLHVLAQAPVVAERRREACNQFLAHTDPGDASYRDLAVADRAGTVICANRPELLGTSVADRPYIAAALDEGQFIVGNYAVERADDGPVLPVAAPVVTPDNDIDATIFLTISLDQLAQRLRENWPPTETALVLVADRDGTVLAHLPDGDRFRGQKIIEPYRTLLQASDDGVIETTAANGRRMLVAYSPAGTAPHRLFVAVAIDKADFFAPLDRDTLRDAVGIALGAAAALGAAWSIATHFVARPIDRLTDAAVRWQHGDYSARAGPGGRVAEIAALAASFDALAAKLEMRERQLREAAEGKRRLLAAAGHDLRQPLQILTFVVGRLGGGAAQERHVAHAEKALDRLTAALDALVEAARLDSGAMQVRRRTIFMAELFDEMSEDWAAAAAAKRLDLRVVPTRAAIDSDPDLIRTILNNLVGNAVKYTARGGVLVGCRRRGAGVRIEVWDTGIGIPPEKLDLVFAEFAQLDRAREGFGLGLAIVQRAAELLGHPLSVTSKPGKGTRFALDVPTAAGS
jgi:signal transduction histidine kinase